VIFFEKIICSYKNIAITLQQFMTLIKMSSLFNKVFMNKKKFFYGFAVLGVAALAACNVNVNSQKVELSDVMLANVEALATESTNVITCYNTCRISPKNPNKSEPVWTITFCNGCSISTCYEYQDSGTCTTGSGYQYV
jgi:hypothetical protein